MEKLLAKPLKFFIVQPFLAFTSIVPILLLVESFGVGSLYQEILKFFLSFIFSTTLEESTTTQLLTIFYTLLLGLSLVLKGISILLKKKLTIKFIHLVVFMTILYGISWLAYTLRIDSDETFNWFHLTFYLFNIFSLFALLVIKKAERDDHTPINIWKEKME